MEIGWDETQDQDFLAEMAAAAKTKTHTAENLVPKGGKAIKGAKAADDAAIRHPSIQEKLNTAGDGDPNEFAAKGGMKVIPYLTHGHIFGLQGYRHII